MSDRTFAVLASVAGGRQIAAMAAAAAPGVRLRFVPIEPGQPPDAAELDSVEIAALTMDVIGDSAGTWHTPALVEFYAALRSARNLHWLHVPTAGADRPIYKELLARGVRLTTSSGSNAMAVAHSAMAGFLALSRKVPQWIAAQKRHAWEPLRGPLAPRDIEGQSAVVVGLGPIGQNIARLLDAFGVRVTGVRRTPHDTPHCARVVTFEEIDSVLPAADWLVLACPLTPQTRGLMDARRLALLPAGAQLVNVSRGEVLDQLALVAALRSARVAGAYLDVFDPEPLAADSPLWDMPGVLVSPHCSGNSAGHAARTMEMFVANIGCWARGEIMSREIVH